MTSRWRLRRDPCERRARTSANKAIRALLADARTAGRFGRGVCQNVDCAPLLNPLQLAERCLGYADPSPAL
jgi:hypothetical protein